MSESGHYNGGRFRKAVRHFLLGRAAQGVTHFILVLWLVRVFSVQDFGAYMALWGVLELMAPLTSFGLLEAVRRFLPELVSRGNSRSAANFVKWVTVARWFLLIVSAGLLWAFSGVLFNWLGFAPHHAAAGRWVIALIASVLAFRFAVEMLETLLEQRYSQMTQALQPLLRLSGLAYLIMASGTASIGEMVVIDLLASCICLLVAELCLVRRVRALEGNGDVQADIRDVLAFSWHMLGANFLQAAASPAALRLIVVRLLGLEAGGMFAFLQQLLQIVARYLPANLLANIIRPMLIARFTASRDTRIVSTATSLLWKSNLLIITGGAIALAAAGDELIGLASGGRFPDAGWIMLTLFVALGGTTQGQLLTQTFQIFDYSRQWRNLSLIALLTPFAVWAGARYGLMGVAVGMVCGTWIRNAIAMFWLKKQATTIELDWAGGVRIVLSGLALVAVGTMADRFAGPWIALAFALLAYAAAMLLLRPLHLDEVDFLGRAARKLAAPARLLARR